MNDALTPEGFRNLPVPMPPTLPDLVGVIMEFDRDVVIRLHASRGGRI
jgi:hypothetical protein